eukprot:gene12739-12868_t
MPHPRWQLDSNMELKAYDATGGLNLADPMTLAALQGLQGRGGLIQLPQQYPQGFMLQAGADPNMMPVIPILPLPLTMFNPAALQGAEGLNGADLQAALAAAGAMQTSGGLIGAGGGSAPMMLAPMNLDGTQAAGGLAGASQALQFAQLQGLAGNGQLPALLQLTVQPDGSGGLMQANGQRLQLPAGMLQGMPLQLPGGLQILSAEGLQLAADGSGMDAAAAASLADVQNAAQHIVQNPDGTVSIVMAPAPQEGMDMTAPVATSAAATEQHVLGDAAAAGISDAQAQYAQAFADGNAAAGAAMALPAIAPLNMSPEIAAALQAVSSGRPFNAEEDAAAAALMIIARCDSVSSETANAVTDSTSIGQQATGDPIRKDYHPVPEELVKTRYIAETLLPTRHGKFRLRGYKHSLDGGVTFTEPTAIIYGCVEGASDVPLRVHDACFTSEVLGSLKCDCAEQLELALEYIRDAGAGMVIYLQQEGRGIGLANKIAAYALQEQGLDTVDANRALGLPDDCREYTSVRNILKDLQVRSVKLMGYLTVKRDRMDHLLGNDGELDGSWCYWNHDGEPTQPTAAAYAEGGMGLPPAIREATSALGPDAVLASGLDHTVELDAEDDVDMTIAGQP